MAVIATALILLAHLALRPVARRVDRLPETTDPEVETIYEFRAVCKASMEAHIRALVVQAFSGGNCTLYSVRSRDLDPAGGMVEVTAELHRIGRDDVALEAAVSRLSLEPSVSSVTWNIRQPPIPVTAGEVTAEE